MTVRRERGIGTGAGDDDLRRAERDHACGANRPVLRMRVSLRTLLEYVSDGA